MSKRLASIGLSMIAGLSITMETNAQTNINGQVNTITTGVPFLRISPDARAGAMGDVGLATSPDANAQYWNVGKIPFAEKKMGVSLTYTPWLKDIVPDIALMYLSGYYKFGENDNQAISGSLRYFNLGDISYTDVNAQSLGTGKPREYSFDLGYSRKLSQYLSVGVSLRYIYSSLITGFSDPNSVYKAASTFSSDIGLYYTKTNELDGFRSNTISFGAAITNLGGKVSYNSLRKDFIPINLGLGAAYTSKLDAYNKITFALDLNKLLVPTPQQNVDANGLPIANSYYYPDKSVVSGVLGSFSDAPGGFSEELREVQVSVGAEYWYQDQFALRAGYFWEDKTKGDRKYFTCGVGAKYKAIGLNFSYLVPSGSGTNRNPLSNTLRVSLVFGFDKFSKDEVE